MTFPQYVSQITPLLKTAARNIGLGPHDTNDVLQTTLLELWKRWEKQQIDFTKNTNLYAVKLMNWRCTDFLRRKIRQKHSDIGEENNLDELIDESGRMKPDTAKDMQEILSAAKKTIRPRDFQVFMYSCVEGHSIEETARKFHLDNQNVYVIRCRTKEKIRQHITDHFNT